MHAPTLAFLPLAFIVITAFAAGDDADYNRQQYEPVIRKAWDASHAFDTLVDGELLKNCGPQGRYAVYGSAWRFEVMPLAPTWPRASANPDLDVQIIGGAYVAQEGRLRFDFSAMATDFDAAAISKAIADACRQYREIGENFLTALGPVNDRDPPADGQRLQGSANNAVQAVSQRLEAELQRWPNGWVLPLYMALIEAEPLDQ